MSTEPLEPTFEEPFEPDIDRPYAGTLLELPLRIWAEIGRTRMPAASVVGMPHGAILDLDREPDEPADIYVNGRHFGTGRVILVDGEWAVRIETLDDRPDAVEQPSSDGQESAPAAD